MSLELAQLFCLRVPETVGPLHVKVNATLGAVLAFATSEAAVRCARANHFEPDVVRLSEVFSDDLARGALVIFHTAEEVELAYENPRAYDFSTHLRPWPSK